MSSESSSQPHPGEKFTQESKYKDKPDAGHCHIYYVHQNGEIYWKRNAMFKNSAEGSLSESDGNNYCGDDRLTLMSVTYTVHTLQL
jgi:hypothetical protein